MTSTQLSNYLRSNRKRLGLSQDEVAFLLGSQTGSKVSRYEMFEREPNLATALAFEAIMQRPVSEIFAGIYQNAEREVSARAKALSHRKVYQTSTRENAFKRQALAKISAQSQTRS
jgi:transcriptional regulator with XRE-family HTH domain